uniref:Uncharacterized protein n=1 Tax=Trypanosoma congolense (strain IL3000) TaxID=1068625 RepID=G0UX70_TRYCI|nr:conserved hypothetical protein [Trypanosoma congolense IL3000]
MAVNADDVWSSMCFYKAYLPPTDSTNAAGYVVLALEEDGEALCDNALGTKASSLSPSPSSSPWVDNTIEVTDDRVPLDPLPAAVRSTELNPLNDSIPLNGDRKLDFFLFKKRDISPPCLKGMLGKIRHCFLLCWQSVMGKECNCSRAHLLDRDSWRLKLSSFGISKLYVSSNFSVHSINTEQIRLTAGFLLACGLLHENIVQAVQPILCRYNDRCRYGSRCLFVHADIGDSEHGSMTAATPLRSLLTSQEDLGVFLNHLEDLELYTVGDVQRLSTRAFDAIVNSSPVKWKRLWLNISIFRDIQPKAALESLLITFPGVRKPVSLPPSLTNVLSLLSMSSKEFYALSLNIHVQAACEKIRARFISNREYRTIELRREGRHSFFTHVTPIILNFRKTNAHCSWRKKDPNRPVVTSLITYVDPNTCRCHVNDGENVWQTSPLPVRDADVAEDLKFPQRSWCSCPRSYVVAVNYELSTPSGSRCSEQNALGKLASKGLPTHVVREVFVHGENKASQKDPNPLFPCGVCENMLRKVAHDVFEAHGGDIMLYMYDSTTCPKQLVYLPITEISYRDDKGFREFVSELHE